ncbi:MAG: HDOD domain-containing protein [Spirochaetes bacterium]|nr:HDOD domain-containing protein [Spirochaetota bacterium]
MNPTHDNTGVKIDQVVSRADRSEFSSIKSIVMGIVEIINNPDSTVQELKQIIETDPPLTARVLKISNSVYYGGRGRIGDIEQAVIWIGFDTLKEIALNQKVCELFRKEERIHGYSRPLLWRHCVCCALLCKYVYKMEFNERGENAYVAGLLHDIGIIVEDQFLHTQFEQVLQRCAGGDTNLQDAENELLGYDHMQVGGALAKRWCFPDELVHAIEAHHSPDRTPAQFERLAVTTYICNHLCQKSGEGYKDAPRLDDTLYSESLKLLGLHPFSMEIIVEKMQQEIERRTRRGWL